MSEEFEADGVIHNGKFSFLVCGYCGVYVTLAFQVNGSQKGLTAVTNNTRPTAFKKVG